MAALRLLDLFCGAGGAAMGYHWAGFDEIVGIDIAPQKNYPFTFIQGDAIAFLDAVIDGQEDNAYDLVHASPPCQAYSTSTRSPDGHPRLIEETRAALEMTGRPSVMENVVGAPLRRDVLLCGSMFGAEYRRHRVFEIEGFAALNLSCLHHRQPGRVLTITGHAAGQRGQANRHSQKYADLAEGVAAMDTPWMTKTSELVEAIPPAYTEYLGRQFLDQLARL